MNAISIKITKTREEKEWFPLLAIAYINVIGFVQHTDGVIHLIAHN